MTDGEWHRWEWITLISLIIRFPSPSPSSSLWSLNSKYLSVLICWEFLKFSSPLSGWFLMSIKCFDCSPCCCWWGWWRWWWSALNRDETEKFIKMCPFSKNNCFSSQHEVRSSTFVNWLKETKSCPVRKEKFCLEKGFSCPSVCLSDWLWRRAIRV